MKVKEFGSYYILRLQKGEEIITSLRSAFEHTELKGVFFFGLGVGENLVLGYFDARRKTYIKKLFAGEYEFTSFAGNIARHGRDCIVHCHVTITDREFHAFGGHLFQGTVPATCEIVMLPLRRTLRRKLDTTTGLKLLDM
jgi:predicted DNA-binding protein with PD1-like motif